MEPTEVVQAQLEAYNRHDLEAFVSWYAPDAQIRHADGRLLMEGTDAIRARYAKLFADHPDVAAVVPTRIEADGWVVDEERVQLRDRELHVAVGYEVGDDLIRRVVMMRSDL